MTLKVLCPMGTNIFLNKWVVCKVLYYQDEHQVINELDLVHDNYKTFVKESRIQTIYKCTNVDDVFLTLKARSFEIKVKPDAVKSILPISVFSWGDIVQESERPEIQGEIDNIIWHDKDQEYKYFIKVEGKLKTRRYSFTELKLIK